MVESMQHRLDRNRPPRVQITYDVEIGNAIEKKELPFVVGILADLSGNPPEAVPDEEGNIVGPKEKGLLKERKFIEIDRDNFDTVLAGIAPGLDFSTDNVLKADGGKIKIALRMRNMDDFGPLSLVQRDELPDLKALYEARGYLRDFLNKLDGNDALDAILQKVIEDTALQDEIQGAYKDAADWKAVTPTATIEKMFKKPEKDDSADERGGGMVLHPSQQAYALQMVGQFATDIIPRIKAAAANADAEGEKLDAAGHMSARIAEIDHLLALQLNAILHHPDYRELESLWRGMSYLVFKTETSTRLKLRVLNVTKDELLKDMQKASDFDQSVLFKKVYEDEYGTYGGQPYSMLLAAYEFGRHPEDIELLEKLSGVASAAHAPLITSAYARLFDMEDFTSLSKPRDLSKLFESAELQRWRSFRESPDSRYVTLTLPRVLLRLPYGENTVRVDGMNFEEDVAGPDADKFLWGNSAFMLAERITHAFAVYGWTAAIRGVEGGGLVEGLPNYTYKTIDGDIDVVCPTQLAITDRREKELNDLGFIALCYCKGTDKAAFFGGQTSNQPRRYNTAAANANASISAMLPYMLNASRFAHYIKVIMREKVGSFQTRAAVEDYLNTWLNQYVLLDESAGQESKAAFPLQQGRVVVTDIPGKPGSFKATVFLKPHFQLEELTTSIRLVAEIPA